MTVTEGDRGQRPGQTPATGGANGAHNGTPADLREDEMATARTARVPRAAAARSSQPPAKQPWPGSQPGSQPPQQGGYQRPSQPQPPNRQPSQQRRSAAESAAESTAESAARSAAQSAQRPAEWTAEGTAVRAAVVRAATGGLRLSERPIQPVGPVGAHSGEPAPRYPAVSHLAPARPRAAELDAASISTSQGPGQAEDVAARAARARQAGPDAADRADPAESGALGGAQHSAAGPALRSRAHGLRAGGSRGAAERAGPGASGAPGVARPDAGRYQPPGCAFTDWPSSAGPPHGASGRGPAGRSPADGADQRCAGSCPEQHPRGVTGCGADAGCRCARVASGDR